MKIVRAFVFGGKPAIKYVGINYMPAMIKNRLTWVDVPTEDGMVLVGIDMEAYLGKLTPPEFQPDFERGYGLIPID